MTQTTAYRSIMKATSIFGGVQAFNIFISLLRGKAVAVLIGPAGMGLNGLFLSGINLVRSISTLGIEESAVRDLAESQTQDKRKFDTTYTVFKSWVWFTAFLGALISILFAPLLSRFAFGDDSQTFSFMLLSSTFIFGALTGGIYTVLRATRKIGQLAKANIYGSVSGLIVTLPILYIWGIEGVMPSIIAASVVVYLVSKLFRKYVDVEEINISLKRKFILGRPMVIMGINMSLTSLLGHSTAFLLSIFITRFGGLDDLGLYSAANAIMVGYVGMVFNAMSADYFPRLAQAIKNEDEWKIIVNQQAEIILLILIIVLSMMMGSIDFLIKLLLSDKFLKISGYLLILAFSVPLKSLEWSLGFLYLAKGESKVFLIAGVIANVVFLSLNLIGYYYNGLIGIAMAQVIGYLIAVFVNILYIKKRYNFLFSKNVLRMIILSIIFLLAIFMLTMLPGLFFSWIKWIIILVAVLLSLKLINDRIDVLPFFKSQFGRK